jgi:hypothetical protein
MCRSWARWKTWLLLMLLAGVRCGSTRTVVSDDAGQDAARTDDGAPPVDGLVLPDGPTQRDDGGRAFPAILEGVWLVGWSGGMNHFSWVRFGLMASRTMEKKDLWILQGADIIGNLPFWSCSGQGTYWMGAAGNTIYIDFPSTTCVPGKTGEGYVWSDFALPGSPAPPGAILTATVKTQATLQALEGIKYPDDWCDAAMTSCKAPF